jgi:hypothetical protein
VRDATLGVREGWVRRRRGRTYVTLGTDEVLSLEQGSTQHHVRFVPAATAGRRRAPAPRRRIEKMLVWAAVCSLAVHGWIWTGIGLWSSPPWRPSRLGAGEAATPQGRAVLSQAQPLRLPEATYASGPRGRATPRVPGGERGYHVFGLLEAAPTYDPLVPPPGEGVTLKRAAAFLRGSSPAFGVPTAAGSPWRLDPAGPVRLSRQGGLDPAGALAVISANRTSLEACYARATPADAGLTGRVELTWTIAASGKVTAVDTTSAPADAPLLECLGKLVGAWRFPRFKGAEVTASYTFVFKRIGFE